VGFDEVRSALSWLGRIFFADADVEGVSTVDHAMASGFQTAIEVAKFLG